jgi:hypothetical protein
MTPRRCKRKKSHPYAVRVYARRTGKDSDLTGPEGWDRIDRFAEALSVRPRPRSDSRSFPVEFLGVFDTVKATRFPGRDIRWPYTNQLPNVQVVRHAGNRGGSLWHWRNEPGGTTKRITTLLLNAPESTAYGKIPVSPGQRIVASGTISQFSTSRPAEWRWSAS